MTKPAVTFALLLPTLMAVDVLRSKNRQVEEGNAQLGQGKAAEALSRYDKAAARLPSDPAVRFDRGTALSALGKHEEAASEFLRATEAKAPALKGAAFYNLGNSFFHTNKFGEAIEAYKRALALNPGDRNAKWNLEIAQQKKREDDQKKQQDKQNKDNQDKDKNKNDQNKDDQSSKDQNKDQKQQQADDQKKDDKQPQDDKQAEQKPPENNQGENKPKPDKPEEAQPPDLREVDAVLDSLERSPKALEQERARLRAVRRRPPQKDW